MNIDTGKIERLPEEEARLIDRLMAIDEDEMTPKQRKELQVNLADRRSVLGKKLAAARRAERSKYVAHVGAKESLKRSRVAEKIASRQADRQRLECGESPEIIQHENSIFPAGYFEKNRILNFASAIGKDDHEES